MSDIVYRWIQTRLGMVMNWRAETFCNKTRDGYLLCQILRSYEIINREQLSMIIMSDAREVCLENFEKYIVNWLKNIDVFLENEEVEGIVDCKGLTSLCVFYKVFLELNEKNNLTFIAQQRLNEKLRPSGSKFTVTEVHSSPLKNMPTMKTKYTAPLSACYDVIHWHQDRLENLISRCRSAREEYYSFSKMRQRRLSSNYSSVLSNPSQELVKKELKHTDEHFGSVKSVDLAYDELVDEQNRINAMESFIPDPRKSKNILKSVKAKIQKQAENSILKKELQMTLLNSLSKRIQSEESIDINKDLTEKLLKQSLYEKQMLRKLGEIKQQREVMIRNKQAISDAIMKEKEAEFVEKLLQKDKEFSEAEYEYYLEKEKSYELHKRILNEKERLRAERCNKMCRDIIEDICNIAIKESEYKELFEEEPTRTVKDTWKKIFLAGEALENFISPLEDIVKSTDDLTEEMETILHMEIERQDKLDKMDFESYTNFEWPWELENIQVDESLLQDMKRGENILGFIVHVLLEMKYPFPPPIAPPNLPRAQIAACVNGLADESCLRVLQNLLKHKEIVVIEMQDAINFCVNAFKEETKPDDENEPPSEGDTKKKKMKGKPKKESKHKKGSKPGSENLPKKTEPKQEVTEKVDKIIQTPKKYPCEEIQLTAKAEMGRVAVEVLSDGKPLTDYLLTHMFIEFLNSTPDIKGWVLINYPSTLDQAVLLEETLTGVSVPSMYKVSKEDEELLDLELECEEPIDEYAELRQSNLLKNPVEKKDPFFFDSALTAYIKMNHLDDDEAISDVDLPESPEQSEKEVPPLERFYSDMGNNYSMYFKNLNFETTKYLAKLIIGDYSIPPKSSIELFGDTIRYINMDQMDTDKSPARKAKSLKKGSKKEPERREKVTKTKEEVPNVEENIPDSTKEKPNKKGKKEKKEKKEKKGKKGKKGKPEPVIIVHEDKFTQIPEIIYEEVENDEEKEDAAPGEPGWEYIRMKLPEELQISLASIWENAERVYMGDFNQVMFMKRLASNPIMPAVNFFKQHMRFFEERPDDKQLYLRKFQQTYNEFDDEIRSDEEFKAELHCRVNEMREKLIEVCDRIMMETEQERCRLLNKGWAPKQLIEIINNYINGLQLELDRNVDTFILLNDYYTGIITKMPNEDTISKEILLRYEVEDLEIKTAVTNVLEDCESTNENPLDNKIEQNFNKALLMVNKWQNWAWSVFEKGKSQLLPNDEKGKATKKEKKIKKGEKINFEPDEEVKKNANHILDEWSCALRGETARLFIRINLLKFDLKQSIDGIISTMRKASCSEFERIRSKYRNEVDCIYEACNFLSRAIEAESPIQEELLFKDSKFFVNANVIHFPDPPTPEKPEHEINKDSIFTISQLELMTEILFDLAPSGYIPERSFVYLLQDMIADEEKAMTPKSWTSLSAKQVEELSKRIFGSEQLIRWKQFILYNLMVPFPGVEELLIMRRRTVELDSNLTEIITEEQYEDLCFWFETTTDETRPTLAKSLLFKLYKMRDENFNYTALLFDFCKGESTPEGLAKAISLSIGRPVCWDEEVGKRFVEDTLEKRREHEEEVRIRDEERKQTEEFVKSIIDERIDETVHKCDSVVIEEYESVKDSEINDDALRESPDIIAEKDDNTDDVTNLPPTIETNEKSHVKIEETGEKLDKEEDENVERRSNDKLEDEINPEDMLNEEGTGSIVMNSSQSNDFTNEEIGFETNINPNLQYFIQLDDILSVLTIVLSWILNIQNIEDQSFSEVLEEIFEECKNSQFNDEVLSHEFLNHPKLSKLMSDTTTFLVKNPPKIVEELLAE